MSDNENERVARVFPRRTAATPDDPLAFVGAPGLFPPVVDRVHVSVTFSWDIPEAYRLAEEWSPVAPVTVGGPATGARGEDFTPGMYLKPGYVITSRGCPNRCWFCSVPKREGSVRELPIKDGWNVLDDNLLACSWGHIACVLDMLKRQPRRPEFTGGLEAKRLTPALAEAIQHVHPKTLFFAYDTPDDWEPLVAAAGVCWQAGFTKASHTVRCYVLCGWNGETVDQAERRLEACWQIGVLPFAQLYQPADRWIEYNRGWRALARKWSRPAAMLACHSEMEALPPVCFEVES